MRGSNVYVVAQTASRGNSFSPAFSNIHCWTPQNLGGRSARGGHYASFLPPVLSSASRVAHDHLHYTPHVLAKRLVRQRVAPPMTSALPSRNEWRTFRETPTAPMFWAGFRLGCVFGSPSCAVATLVILRCARAVKPLCPDCKAQVQPVHERLAMFDGQRTLSLP